MSSEEPDFSAIDDYIRIQLAKAAEAYASGVDIDARLRVILASGKDTDHDDVITGDWQDSRPSSK